MTCCLLGENNLKDSKVFIKKHGGQKEVEQYFSSAKKKMSIQNAIYAESILQEWKEIKTLSDAGKLKGYVTSRPTLRNG